MGVFRILFLVGILSLFFGQRAWGQDVILNSQADVDGFDGNTTIIIGDLIIRTMQADDPIIDLLNLSNLSSIHGDLIIENNDVLISLNQLISLENIGNSLVIKNNSLISNLEGLQNIDSISGHLNLRYNSNLTEIDDLSNLTFVGGTLFISNNHNLLNIDGLLGLTKVDGSLMIINNDSFQNIDGLQNLTYIGEAMTINDVNATNDLSGLSALTYIGGDIEISANDLMTSLAGLEQITEVYGDLIIQYNYNLLSYDGLENLSSVQGDFDLRKNSYVQNIDALSNLNYVQGYLYLMEHNFIENVDGFFSLDSVGDAMYIKRNFNLKNLNGLSNLKIVNDWFGVRENNSLNDISGLNNVMKVGGSFTIYKNQVLDTLPNFDNLEFIGDKLSITGGDSLFHINGFGSLNYIGGDVNLGGEVFTKISGFNALDTVGGSFHLIHNDFFASFTGFNSLKYIGENLKIWNNDSLQHFHGPDNLEFIGGDFHIAVHDVLETIEGFQSLNSVMGKIIFNNNYQLQNLNILSGMSNISELEISENDNLFDLSGCENIISIQNNLRIFSNPNLINCCDIHQLLEMPDAVGGSIYISNNPANCSSETEILENCIIHVFTNPACIDATNGTIQIQTFSNAPPYQYIWQNTTNGQTNIGIANENDFTISNLAEGTYHLTVTDAEGNEFIEENLLLTSIPGSIFEIVEITTTNSSNTFNNGAIHLKITGGFAPYHYQWSGMSSGSQSGVDSLNFSIPNLEAGEYNIIVTDDNGGQQTISLTLLDETVPVFPCTQPLDIVILNDVSGSVDAIEYMESKAFFVNFLEAANIGTGADDSRAAIIEWSNANAQSVQIPMTDDLTILQSYVNNSRAFSGGTMPHNAMIFGENYLASVARPNVARVLILSTDGSGGQVSPSLIGLADQYKAQGYHIITVAFDNAFSEMTTREILREVASINLLAPGAPAYFQLDQNLAENIVNLYLCPIDPGSSATVYFERDGTIDILDIQANGGCPSPNFVEVTFSIEAKRELSIPSGMPVTFYYNNPAIFGATPILTWQVPCAIEAGTTDIFTVSLPVTAAANIFAVLNDDGNLPPPIALPVTDIDELAYSNNVADTTICTEALPTLQTFKYTTTPIPICNNTVIYQVDVCNITSLDALEVIIADDAPDGFILQDSLVNTNGCATANNGNFDIPAGCCVSVTYIYDASAAENGNYNNQDVDISGITNQIYLDFDGYGTPTEDVLIDGTIDCPTTEINFTKSVNVTESCEDAFVVFTFTIDNQLNIPLNSVSFSDILPTPVTWVFQPYNLNGLSISNANINGNSATFLIDEIAPNTVATFSMDASLNDWAANGILSNTATLNDVLDLENGGLQTLTSNTTATEINALSEIQVIWSANCAAVVLNAQLLGETSDIWQWQTLGDGSFENENTATPTYTPGTEDLTANSFFLLVTGQSQCGEINKTIEITIDPPLPVPLELATCQGTTIDYQNVTLNIGDNMEFTLQNHLGCDSLVAVSVVALPSDASDLVLETCENEPIFYQNTLLNAGATETFIFQNIHGCDSVVAVTVNGFSVHEETLFLEACAGTEIAYHDTFLAVNETATFTFFNQNGCDSVVNVFVSALPITEEMQVLQTCENEPITYQNRTFNIGEKATFTFQNYQGCDSIVHIVVENTENEANLAIPNAFTPNGDGQNDCFGMVNAEEVDFRFFELKIFDRWGNRVFYTTNPTECWSGETDGQTAAADVYFWRMEAETRDCKINFLKMGDLTLLR